MKSGKKRRAEIKAKRQEQKAKHRPTPVANKPVRPPGTAPVNPELLAPYNSYGAPKFVYQGYYTDLPFQCTGCGKEEIWTATQQKWWYEVAKGYVYSTAKHCRACRRREQTRRSEARRIHLEGVARKRAAKPKKE